MNALFERMNPLAHNLWRIVIGFTFMTHGGQKLFTWFGGDQPVVLMSRFGVAGIVEFFGGLLILTGFLTRPAAFLAAGEMAVAYWWIHVGTSGHLWHWQNQGELPLVYCFSFLALAALGGGTFSVDAFLARRKAA